MNKLAMNSKISDSKMIVYNKKSLLWRMRIFKDKLTFKNSEKKSKNKTLS